MPLYGGNSTKLLLDIFVKKCKSQLPLFKILDDYRVTPFIVGLSFVAFSSGVSLEASGTHPILLTLGSFLGYEVPFLID